MEPNFKIDGPPGCRGDCNEGRSYCPAPDECRPDSPRFARTGCLIVAAVSGFGWGLAIILVVWLAGALL
jgi:hypothetical protein